MLLEVLILYAAVGLLRRLRVSEPLSKGGKFILFRKALLVANCLINEDFIFLI